MRARNLRGALAGKVLAMSGGHCGTAASPAQYSPLAAMVAGALVAMAVPAVAQAQQQARVAFSIPAQPLPAALRAFAAQAKQQLLFDEDKLARLRAPALEGTYAPSEALNRLLVGTGMVATQSSPGLFTIKEVPVVPAENAGRLAEVTVTAEADRSDLTTEGTGTYAARGASIMKGAQSLREIPQSISVMTREQMNDQGITRLEQAYAQMPGVRLDGYSELASIMVRGFSASKQTDGVPAQNNNTAAAYDLDPAIYDRIEFLRGPSGLLTGTGEPGGTINLVRKRPQRDYKLAANFSIGSWNNRRTEWDITGPLNEDGSLRGRAVAVVQNKKEFYQYAREQRRFISGMLEYDITSRDVVGFSVTHQQNRGNEFWGLPRYSDGSLPGRKSYVGSTDVPSQRDITEVSVDYQHKFDNDWVAKASFVQKHQDAKWSALIPFSMINVNTGLISSGLAINLDRDYDNQSFDVNFSGPISFLGRTHKATFGFNRATNDGDDIDRLNTYPGAINPLVQHNFGGSASAWPSYGVAFKEKQSGAYGSLNLKINDPLTLILGGRLTSYSISTRSSTTSPWVDGDAKASNEFTPYAGLVYELSKELSIYGSYAEIFIPQSQMEYSGSMVRPRVGGQFEMGIKGSFFNNSLNSSLAIYQLRDKNRAVLDTDSNHVCTGSSAPDCYRAAGQIQSRGFEAEVSGSPVPGLNLSGSYTFNRTKYLSDSDPSNVGKTVDEYRNPKHLFKLWAQYKFADGPWADPLRNWIVAGGMTAQSRIRREPYKQGSYAVYSAKIGYRVDKNTDIGFEVDNLFDRVYLRDLGTSTLGTIYGKPRSYSLTLNHRFN